MGATAAIRLNDTGGVDTESLIAIRCGDQTPTAVTREQVVKLLKARYKVSRMGGDVADYLTTRCARWGMRAKERYQGDFRAKTKHPLLIIGNTLDSVTPISSARNVSSGFPGSVVLENGGLGVSLSLHCVSHLNIYLLHTTQLHATKPLLTFQSCSILPYHRLVFVLQTQSEPTSSTESYQNVGRFVRCRCRRLRRQTVGKVSSRRFQKASKG